MPCIWNLAVIYLCGYIQSYLLSVLSASSMLSVFSDNHGCLLLNLVHHPEVGLPYEKGYIYEKCKSAIKNYPNHIIATP